MLAVYTQVTFNYITLSTLINRLTTNMIKDEINKFILTKKNQFQHHIEIGFDELSTK